MTPIEKAIKFVQECREEGETDLRTIISYLRSEMLPEEKQDLFNFAEHMKHYHKREDTEAGPLYVLPQPEEDELETFTQDQILKEFYTQKEIIENAEGEFRTPGYRD